MSVRPKTSRVLSAWLAGSGAAYFLTSFFSNLYPAVYQFVFLSISWTVLCSAAFFWIADEVWTRLRTGWRAHWIGLLALLLASCLTIGAVAISTRFPGLFDSRLLFMERARLPLFLGLAVLSLPLFFWLSRGLTHPPSDCIRKNLPGLILAALFFTTYFTLAATINFPGHRTLDQYFDTDISAWLARLQAASPRDITDVVRAVHPAVLLFLRPLVWFFSLFLTGDRLHAIYLVHALAAASCVFLTWRIVRRASGNASYALIMASILGASASHLLLGSMLETYIYSALALLIFVSILQNENSSLKATVPAGFLVFGITVTNLAQTVILYSLKRPRIKVIFQYVSLVVVFTLFLHVLQVWIYPAAEPLSLSNLRSEQKYQPDLAKASWYLQGRVSLTARAVLLYGMVAPKPFILMEELGMDVPNFRTFEIAIGEFHVAGYSGLADWTVKFWMLLLVASVIFFLWNWFKNPKPMLALGLFSCLGFNFALHVIYGDDPMLYSPDWVYALVLYAAFSFERVASHKWFQMVLILFLALMMIVNMQLVYQIMQVSAPFYGR